MWTCKDDKHSLSELIDGDTLISYKIDKKSNVFYLLTRISDEVHRFTINYHRQIRSKGSISSILDEIEGIGETRKKELIKAYGSVKKMSDADIEELEKIIPHNVAINLKEYLENWNNNKQNKEQYLNLIQNRI